MKKHSQKYYLIFFSYIAALLIPITLGSLFFINDLKLVQQQSAQLNEAMLSVIQSDNDKIIRQLKQLSASLLANNVVQQLKVDNNSNQEIDPDTQYLQYKLFQEINNIMNLSDRVSDAFVYLKRSNRIVGMNGILTPELYYAMYLKSEQFSQEDFLKSLNERHYMDFISVECKNANDNLLMVSNELSFSDQPDATVVIVLDSVSIENTLQETKWNDLITMNIFDSAGQMLFSTEEDKATQAMFYANYEPGLYTQKDVMGKKGTILVRQSSEIGWKYVIAIPQSVYEKNGRSIQAYFFAMILLSAVIGLLFAWYMTRKTYNPLKSFIEFFSAKAKVPSVALEDEYQWLHKEAETFFAEHEDAKKTIEDNRKHLQTYNILRLIEYPYENLENMQPRLEKNGIFLAMPYNLVVLFSFNFPQTECYISELDEKERRYHELIIENIFSELITEHFSVYMTVVGDYIAAVINFPQNDGTCLNIIKDGIEQLQEVIKQHFPFEVIALMGKCHEGLAGIHRSYCEASELLSYTSLFDTMCLSYEDVADVALQYDYSMDTEQKIINLLRAGNDAAAVIIINDIIDAALSQRVAASVYRCLIFDMLSTFLKVADIVGYKEMEQDFEIVDKFSYRMSVKKQKNMLSDLAFKIANKVREQQNEDRNNQLSTEVNSFVQENFSNPDLNVAITAQKFGLSATYLSSLYKKQTGDNLLEYITNVRIEKVKELLYENYSVTEIAKMVGLRDSGSLIRIFKRKTGITPGQIKAQLMKEKTTQGDKELDED